MFWERADLALAAEGELTRRYDAHRAATAAPAPAQPLCLAGAPALARVTFHWADGTHSVIYPATEPSPAAT